ncbi:Uracil-DNA glycosylase [Pacmanvirus A23]|uniref:Uracil-DNA glycosylase n=1 Tax=Pacmanvirus A23 TaxID=1932881 RepID=UPI000A09635C|nr:Uracil-DNA glycosylase [Pacmanvirus A23]SIP86107.1 Uracil-DNA glycosylase [Pacmanvirus A23]
MDTNDIKSMFEGLTEDTKEIIARKLKKELSAAIIGVNKKLTSEGLTRKELTPSPELIFNAFRLCGVSQVKVILLGQDPYINPGEAMGLSFSVPKGKKIPPSLRNIYNCLMHHGLIKIYPEYGDLTNWAKQGVLLLNTSLTTRLGKSNAHSDVWCAYTDALIHEISNLPRQLIFILLGEDAKKKAKLVDKRRHVVLEWGHPSPLNPANRTDNPKNFKYCNVFSRVNDMLILRGEKTINWDPESTESAPVIKLDEINDIINNISPTEIVNYKNNEIDEKPKEATEPTYIKRQTQELDPTVPRLETLYVFTDGGSTGNGYARCSSSWAFYITDGTTVVTAYGLVEEVEIPGQVYKSSNNRGELTAIMKALEYIYTNMAEFTFNEIEICSDSEYSINCLDKWVANWLANPAKSKLSEKKNLDVIVPAKEILDDIRQLKNLKFRHVRSHLDEPYDQSSEEWFRWKCNDIVDKYCNVALGRKVNF